MWEASSIISPHPLSRSQKEMPSPIRSELVTHRVVEKQEISQEFVTKGDANETPDPLPVSYRNVVGRAAKWTIPYAGYFVSFGKTPAVIGIMVAILVIGIILDNVTADGKKNGDDQ